MAQPSKFVLINEPYGVVSDPMDLVSLIDRKVSLRMAPISGRHVGAVGLGFSRKVFLGINVELPGLPLHHSIHAEQFLVINLMLNSEQHLTHLAVSSSDSVFHAPCGHCRQFLQEITEASIIQVLIKDPALGIQEFVTLKSLLPRHSNLLPDLLQARDNKLLLVSSEGCEDRLLLRTALAAANRSFAPYSKCPSGVALKDREGQVYRGWYIESAAYNPSLGPVQAALVDFVISVRTKFEDIVEAVLVEKRDAVVSQEKTAKMILETIADPKCAFKVFHCI